jgi:hypothetical protein
VLCAGVRAKGIHQLDSNYLPAAYIIAFDGRLFDLELRKDSDDHNAARYSRLR